MTKIENLIVIGAGPAGFSAGMYSARAGLKPKILRSTESFGQLFFTSKVENFPGIKPIMGPELMKNFEDQALSFGAEVIQFNVSSLKKDGKVIILSNDQGKELKAKAVIVATGSRNLWLGLESEQRLIGKGVSKCAICDALFFKEKIVAVVGGGDSAMEDAFVLSKVAKKVFIIHRGEELTASKFMQDRVLRNKNVEVLFSSEVIEVLGNDRVTGIKILNKKENNTKELSVNGLFVAIGGKPNSEFLRNSGVLLTEKGYVITSENFLFLRELGQIDKNLSKNFNFRYVYQSSLAGVFAAGDVADFRFKQASYASGMGVGAALEVEKYLREV